MSVTVNCFENLNLTNCQSRLSCCRKNSASNVTSQTTNNAVFMNTARESGGVTIVPIPPQPDKDFTDTTTALWDTITVDANHCIVSIFGDHVLKLLRVEQPARVHINDAFPESMAEVCNSLIEVALEGKSGVLHTMFNGESLSMYAYTLRNDKERIIGAHLIYRPTRYDQKGLIQLIKQIPQSN
jgi:hypothetical protein